MPFSGETLDEWVERIKQEPIWREVAVLIDRSCIRGKGGKSYKDNLLAQLVKVFSDDVFSLHWLEAPQEIEVIIASDIIQQANTIILHARNEVTQAVPEKEHLWRALRSLYEECRRLQATNILLADKVKELENEVVG